MGVERKIVNLIFDFFRQSNYDDKKSFVSGTIYLPLSTQLTPYERSLFPKVYDGLLALQYIESNLFSPFHSLTRKGMSFVYNDLALSHLAQLPWIIPSKSGADWEKEFNKLWRIIGPQDTALFYLSGSKFLSIVSHLDDSITPNYSLYIQQRRDKGLSTSRIDYYRDLLLDLKEEQRYELFVTIQREIEESAMEEINTSQAINTLGLFTDNIVEGEACNTEPKLEPTHSDIVSSLQPTSNPTVFISYSWDDDRLKNWVREVLATQLMKNGVNVILDQWELSPGKKLPHFMEESVANAQKVILLFTPNYKRKAEHLEGGVGAEYSIINGDIFSKNSNFEKYIPILLKGTREESVPGFFKGVIDIEMVNDSEFTTKFEDLLRAILDKPKFKKPVLGMCPNLE